MKDHFAGSMLRKVMTAGCVLMLLTAIATVTAQQPEPTPYPQGYPAQTPYPQNAPSGYPPQAAPAPAPYPGQQAPQQMMSPEQLNDLVAPIALYPDPLVGQVLVASTYPLEIVEANQWLQQNRGLTGQALIDAAKQQPWDPSVQALVAFPEVLGRLAQNTRWTTDLGNAFLAQQADVMNAVQVMRGRAQTRGVLSSNPQQTVTTQQQPGQPPAIVIQPAQPDVVYVPSYDPMYAYGPPLWGYYPPMWYPSFGWFWGPGIHLGFSFGGFGFGLFGGWGWGPSWFGHGVFVNAMFFNHFGFRTPAGIGFRGTTGMWAHDPAHRGAVGYSNPAVAARYGNAAMAARANSTYRGAAAGAYRGNAAGAYRGNAAGAYRGGGNSYAAPRSAPGGAYNNARPGGSYNNTRPPAMQRSAPAPQQRSAPAPRSSGGGGGGRAPSSGGSHSGGGGHAAASHGGGHHA